MLNKTGSYLLESAETMDIYYTTFYNNFIFGSKAFCCASWWLGKRCQICFWWTPSVPSHYVRPFVSSFRSVTVYERWLLSLALKSCIFIHGHQGATSPAVNRSQIIKSVRKWSWSSLIYDLNNCDVFKKIIFLRFKSILVWKNTISIH